MRTPLLLYLLALAVRLLLIAHFPDPAYPDSSYYVDAARALHEGHGLNVDFIWIFAEVGGRIPANPVLPIPAFGHWLPLASLVQVPFLALLGEQAWASALPFALAGALAAPLAWAIGREAGASRAVSVGAGVLTALPALATPFMAQPDNFSLFQPLVAGALWLTARGLKGHAGSYALAGLLVGLATLSRNDGVLAGAAVGIAFLWDRWRAWRSDRVWWSAGTRRPSIPLWSAVACAGLFALVMAPWVVRQLDVFGTLSPSTASGKALFIRTIAEWNDVDTPATLGRLLDWGAGPLLASRVGGFAAAVEIFTVLVAGIALAPFMLVGGWVRRRSLDFGPFLLYAAVLFGFSALVSAVHVPGGTFIHSAVALAPHAYVLALEGVAAAVAWVAARRRAWDGEAATRVFVGGAVAFGVVTGVAGSLSVHATWDAKRQQRIAAAGALDATGAPLTDRVMSIDAAGFWYWTGRGGVVLVNDPLPTIERVARAYGIRWLALERDEAVPSVAPILAGERPAWVGPPAWTETGTDQATGGRVTTAGLYPVCLDATDTRCAGGGS